MSGIDDLREKILQVKRERDAKYVVKLTPKTRSFDKELFVELINMAKEDSEDSFDFGFNDRTLEIFFIFKRAEDAHNFYKMFYYTEINDEFLIRII